MGLPTPDAVWHGTTTDCGSAANARIVRKLQPGEYWLSVRHKDGNATDP
jgi:hypothetical protein